MVSDREIQIFRGDVVLVDLSGARGTEMRGTRPCVVVQNDEGNKHSPHTIVVPLTKAEGKAVYPFQVYIKKGDGGIDLDSIACCELIRLVDKVRILKNFGHLSEETIEFINDALKNVLELS